MLAPRPSFDSPTPRITPRIRSPALTASRSRFSTTSAAPSAGTSPSASRWKGRLRPLRLIAWSAQKPTWMNRSSARFTAPASIRSACSSCSRSQASLIAYSEEAQAASSAKAPAPSPRALASRCAGSPDMNRFSGWTPSAPGGAWPSSQTDSAKADNALDGKERFPITAPMRSAPWVRRARRRAAPRGPRAATTGRAGRGRGSLRPAA